MKRLGISSLFLVGTMTLVSAAPARESEEAVPVSPEVEAVDSDTARADELRGAQGAGAPIGEFSIYTAEEAVAAEQTSTAAEPATTSSEAGGGARFRFGVAGGVGKMFWEGTSLTYGGMDLRFGAQINDMIAV